MRKERATTRATALAKITCRLVSRGRECCATKSAKSADEEGGGREVLALRIFVRASTFRFPPRSMRRDAGAKFSRSREEGIFTGGTYQRYSDGNTTLRSSSRRTAMAKGPRDEPPLAVDPWDCAVQRPKQQLQARRRRALLVGIGHLSLPRADDRIQSLRCES